MMSLDITEKWMREQIAFSNRKAAQNRNFYPIQEQATQMDIWEYIPCECDENCTCRKHGCTHHWKLQNGIQFEVFRDGFLRMFVDGIHHQPLILALDGKGPKGLNTRAIGAFHVLRKLRDFWPDILKKASSHNKTLFCDEWVPESFRDRMSFPFEGTSIYIAKQYCTLFPDIGIPYDTASRVKIINRFNMRGADYLEFLSRIRAAFLDCMTKQEFTIQAIRQFDNPQYILPYDPKLIALPRPGMDYGTGYLPAERTISIVLDKCFYHPKAAKKFSE